MTRRNNLPYSKAAFAVALVALVSQTAFALREGALGNAPIRNPNWSKGAAAVFNHRARISYWVGPDPGYYTGEFSGDATALSEVLSDFATIESKRRRLVVRDGVRSSGFKQPLDWVFNVWVPSAWERPTGVVVRTFRRDPNECPPPEIIVYTGGNVRWSDVTVPKEIEVVDERLETHGFKPDRRTGARRRGR